MNKRSVYQLKNEQSSDTVEQQEQQYQKKQKNGIDYARYNFVNINGVIEFLKFLQPMWYNKNNNNTLWGVETTRIEKILLERNICVLSDQDGMTPIARYCQQDGIEKNKLAFLLDFKSNVNFVYHHHDGGGTILHQVCSRNNHFQIIELLVNSGASVLETDNLGSSVLHRYLDNSNHINCKGIKFLIENAVDLYTKNVSQYKIGSSDFETYLQRISEIESIDDEHLELIRLFIELMEDSEMIMIKNLIFKNLCSAKRPLKIKVLDLLLKAVRPESLEDKEILFEFLDMICRHPNCKLRNVECVMRHIIRIMGYVDFDEKKLLMGKSYILDHASRSKSKDKNKIVELLYAYGAPIVIGNVEYDIFKYSNFNGYGKLDIYKNVVERMNDGNDCGFSNGNYDDDEYGNGNDEDSLERLEEMMIEILNKEEKEYTMRRGMDNKFNILEYLIKKYRKKSLALGRWIQNIGKSIFCVRVFDAMIKGVSGDDYEIYNLVFSSILMNCRMSIPEKELIEQFNYYCEFKKMSIQVLRILIKELFLEEFDWKGSRIILNICKNTHLKANVLSLFIKLGAPIAGIIDRHGLSPLHVFLRYNSPSNVDKNSIIEILIKEMGNSVDCVDFKGRTPFYYAFKFFAVNVEMFKKFAERGCDFMKNYEEDLSPFIFGMKGEDYAEILEYVLDKCGADEFIDWQSNMQENFLHYICENVHLDDLGELFEMIERKMTRGKLNIPLLLSDKIYSNTPLEKYLDHIEDDIPKSNVLIFFLRSQDLSDYHPNTRMTILDKLSLIAHCIFASEKRRIFVDLYSNEVLKNNSEYNVLRTLYNNSWDVNYFRELLDRGAKIWNDTIELSNVPREKFLVLLSRDEYSFFCEDIDNDSYSSGIISKNKNKKKKKKNKKENIIWEKMIMAKYFDNSLWSIEKHAFFPELTKRKIEDILMIFKIKKRERLMLLPKVLIYKIISFCYPDNTNSAPMRIKFGE